MKAEMELSPRSGQGIVNLAACLLIMMILVIVFRQLEVLLQPLFIAVFIFYIGSPLVRALNKKKVPILVSHLALILIAVAILFSIGWIVGAHVDDLAQKFPAYKVKLQGTFQNTLTFIYTHVPRVEEKLSGVLSGQNIPLAPLEGVVKALVGNFFGFLSSSLLVIFYLIFIYQESTTLPKRLESAYGKNKASQILAIGIRINRGIIGYVYVKGLASVLVAVLSTITMLFFGLDMAMLWGALVFFGNFIPYVGSAVAVLFPIVIGLLQFESLMVTLVMALILIGWQVMVGNYLEPKYAGQQLNLSPLVVLLSLGFWGWLWGVVGLLLSIPIMVSIKFVLENIPATHDLAMMMSHLPRKRRKPS